MLENFFKVLPSLIKVLQDHYKVLYATSKRPASLVGCKQGNEFQLCYHGHLITNYWLMGDSKFSYLRWPCYVYNNQVMLLRWQTIIYSPIKQVDTYQWQWKSCNVLLVSSRQLCALPSDEEHRRLLSMWEACHFASSKSASRACNGQCLHGNSCRLH